MTVGTHRSAGPCQLFRYITPADLPLLNAHVASESGPAWRGVAWRGVACPRIALHFSEVVHDVLCAFEKYDLKHACRKCKK